MNDVFEPLRRQRLSILVYPAALITVGVYFGRPWGPWITMAGAVLALYKTAEVLFFADAQNSPALRRFLSAALSGEAVVALAVVTLPIRNNPNWIPVAGVALAVLVAALIVEGGCLRSILATAALATLAWSAVAFIDPPFVTAVSKKGTQAIRRIRAMISAWDLNKPVATIPLAPPAPARPAVPAGTAPPVTPTRQTAPATTPLVRPTEQPAPPTTQPQDRNVLEVRWRPDARPIVPDLTDAIVATLPHVHVPCKERKWPVRQPTPFVAVLPRKCETVDVEPLSRAFASLPRTRVREKFRIFDVRGERRWMNWLSSSPRQGVFPPARADAVRYKDAQQGDEVVFLTVRP